MGLINKARNTGNARHKGPSTKWLDTRGNSVISIAICARCKMKRAYTDIVEDGNIRGLRVCVYGCRDTLDPYRLPARKTENITVRYPRPDVPVNQVHNNLVIANNINLAITIPNTINPNNINSDLFSPGPGEKNE